MSKRHTFRFPAEQRRARVSRSAVGLRAEHGAGGSRCPDLRQQGKGRARTVRGDPEAVARAAEVLRHGSDEAHPPGKPGNVPVFRRVVRPVDVFLSSLDSLTLDSRGHFVALP